MRFAWSCEGVSPYELGAPSSIERPKWTLETLAFHTCDFSGKRPSFTGSLSRAVDHDVTLENDDRRQPFAQIYDAIEEIC